jgi:hypothetical protein
MTDEVGQPSSEALLLPKVAAGEAISWHAQIINSAGRTVSYDVLCKVEEPSGGAGGYQLEPTVTMHSPSGPPQVKTIFVLRNGRAYDLKGAPLDNDPICQFYYTQMFGQPPQTLRVGSSWQFSDEGTSGGPMGPNAHGSAKVVSIDPNGQIHLDITFAAAGFIPGKVTNEGGTLEPSQIQVTRSGTIDLWIKSGGIITERKDRLRNVSNVKGVENSYDETAYFTLNHS